MPEHETPPPDANDDGREDGIVVRAVAEDELAVWGAAVSTGFLRTGTADAEPPALRWRRMRHVDGRTLGAFDRERCIATFRSMPQELTVPGGALLPASAITGVTVTQTHRRRGLMSRMMVRELAAAKQRGEAVAILIAAEYNIYGRFGFGPATVRNGWVVDVSRAGGLRAGLPMAEGGRIDLVTMDELGKSGAELHERWRRRQPGAIARDEAFWKATTGEVTLPGFPWKEPFAAVHRDASGVVTGLAVYSVDDRWDGKYPDCTLTVQDFLALDQATANSLWQYLLSVDWVRKVTIDNLGPDDALPLLLADPRAATPHPENGDLLWLRLLDVPAAFGARSYAATGRLVLDVTDPAGHAAGRWALETAPDGTGRALPTTQDADLTVPVTTLSSLYLGAETASRLATASLLTEERPEAAADLDLLLRTPQRAWNPDSF